MATERDRQREDTRRRLFDAALDAFRRAGVAGSRIDDIASAAGVSRATFYFHFPAKEDVLLELMHRSQLEMVSDIDALPVDTPLADVLDTVAASMARLWAHDAQLLAEIGMVALRRTAQNLPELDDAHPAQVALSPWFERAEARGEIGDLIPPTLLSQFFLVNLFAAALAWCGNPIVPLGPLLRNVVRFFLRATRPA